MEGSRDDDAEAKVVPTDASPATLLRAIASQPELMQVRYCHFEGCRVLSLTVTESTLCLPVAESC